MSEDDRAAKAARARALLKKKQQEKAVREAAASPAPSHATLPPSRTSSPAPSAASTVVAKSDSGSRDTGDLFGKPKDGVPSDNSWLSGLNRVDVPSPSPAQAISPPPRTTTPLSQPTARTPSSLRGSVSGSPSVGSPLASPPATRHPPAVISSPPPASVDTTETERLRALVLEHERAILTLESDKAALAASVEKLKEVEMQAQHTNQLLDQERLQSGALQRSLQQTQADFSDLTVKLKQQEEASAASLAREKVSLKTTVEQMRTVQAHMQELEATLETESATSQTLRDRVEELEKAIREANANGDQQQQTISLLVSEKTSLSASLHKLGDVELRLSETEVALDNERATAQRLQTRVNQLEEEARDVEEHISHLTSSERQLFDKCRDQERELQLLIGAVDDLRTQAEQRSRRVQELEEQIQNDDRAERLEATLKNTQDRADELEFQISKLKQTNGSLKAERDKFEGEARKLTEAEQDWRNRHAELETQHESAREQLTAVSAERDALATEKTVLQSQVTERQAAVDDLQQRLTRVAAELQTAARQLQQTQGDLRSASARADDAERLQKQLQAEGTSLMRSLDEMRPKLVELTDAKLELTERLDGLQGELRARDATIVQLEAREHELAQSVERAEAEQEAALAALEKERTALGESANEQQKAYLEMSAELEETRTAVRTLQQERDSYKQMTDRHVQEVQQLTATLRSHTEQLTQLRGELDERQLAQSEAQDFLERARGEAEVLRTELAAKDEELAHLRSTAAPLGTPSLDDEMLSALRQQHAIELSSAHSQIRSLETTVYQAEAHAHALQRQVAALEDQLAQARPASRGSLPRRPVNPSDELRRASFTSQRPRELAPPASAFDGLSPEARHKRKVSLSMLKARIDSEVAAHSPAQRTTALPTVVEPPSRSGTPHSHSHSHGAQRNPTARKPQFLDEAHIFWCHACEGDLVIL